MTNQVLKKQEVVKTGINPVIAAVTGVVIAAGGVVAGALAMNDKKNRDAVNSKIGKVKDGAKEYMSKVKNVAQDKKDELDKNITKSKLEVKKAVDSVLT